MTDTPKQKKKAINVRRADVMAKVEGTFGEHYKSSLIEEIVANGNILRRPNLEIHLASAFGFCDGVRRAVEIAYATREAFPNERIWLIGEIIHNPEVNARLDAMGLIRLPWQTQSSEYEQIQAGDVVIIPAFGVTVGMRKHFEKIGAQLVDTTCGNVVKVWHKVKQYAKSGITSIIHGKVKHEESMATASHSRGDAGDGKFLVIFSEDDAHALARTITGRMNTTDFLARFKGSYSVGFVPELDLQEIGMANQTTMLQTETTRIQQILREAMIERDGNENRFHVCDTICGATQDRQNALKELLDKNLDVMFIVGGYNSSNTTHLAHIASKHLYTYFVKDASCILSLAEVRAFDLEKKQEVIVQTPAMAKDLFHTRRIGITAGASCPANVIEAVIERIIELRA